MAVYLGKNKMSFTGGQPVIFYGTDTSDATATENDITKDKIAYANGKRVIGTLETGIPETWTLTLEDGSTVTKVVYVK